MATIKKQNRAASASVERKVLDPMIEVPPIDTPKPANDVVAEVKVKPVKVEVLGKDETAMPSFPRMTDKEREAYSPMAIMNAIEKPVDHMTLNAMLDAAFKSHLDIQFDMQVLACRTLLFCIEKGAIAPARKLMMALGAAGKGASKTVFRADALAKWMSKHGPFEYTDVSDFIDYVTGEPVEKAKGLKMMGEKLRERQAKLKKDRGAFIKTIASASFWIVDGGISQAGMVEFDLVDKLRKLLKQAATYEQKLTDGKLTEQDHVVLTGLAELRRYVVPVINAGQKVIEKPAPQPEKPTTH